MTVKAALDRAISGDWATDNKKEKEYSQQLLNWVAELGPDLALEKLEPILNGAWEILNPGFGIIDSLPPLASIPPFLKGWFPHLPDETQRLIEKAAVLLCAQIFYDQFHYPQPQPYGVPYRIDNDPFEKVKWLYRYWFNQLEVPEVGSGLEKEFREQDLNFFVQGSITKKVTLSCAGDLLAVDVLTPENTPHLFDGITDFYSNVDLVCANLESTVYMNKKTPEESPVGRDQKPGEPA